MSKAAARRAICKPIFPSPTMPQRLPLMRVPSGKPSLGQLPARTKRSAWAMRRGAASIKASAVSATQASSTPGVFVTTTPRARAAARSIVS
ncbi:hypothetical protein D3C78_1772590 [compost metagenome]